ncbi:metal/formaldehyde-sensitive transcriptional repressor [Novosphingobium capsulatum]|jgi:DNA-binding FrmR family transcriptional regulator|uniref:metal/formaldehyde-sensitive transcriptional repressor n=1 Tax=Novosphingobium capsulatum TaxID=13688 RepID=UPI0009FE6011|nr:metal/formaldehyde-sensitive transcriptional repressor [Novosphingobium capsulatum]WQD94695.1 metal/formaldehyde-sensitive transcriptional repressor [Novosphingobium capsulatum]
MSNSLSAAVSAASAEVSVNKRKLLNRVRRLRGQIDAIERALDTEEPCGEVMRRLTAAKGAMNGLMVSVLGGHIREHMIDEGRSPSAYEQQAADDLVAVLKTYIA